MIAPLQFPRLGASACVFREGRVLIVQRAKPPLAGIWSLPGGHVEPGETTRDAAMRELREETGVEAELTHLAGVYDIIRRGEDGALESHYAVVCHAGRWLSGEAKAAGDAADARWVSPKTFSTFDATPTALEAVQVARSLLNI